MDQNTNPLTNIKPAAAATPGTQPEPIQTQGVQPASSAQVAGAQVGQASSMPHMPSMMETLNMAAKADSAPAVSNISQSAVNAPMNTGTAGMASATNNALPGASDAVVQDAIVETTSVNDVLDAPGVSSAGSSESIERDEVLETLSMDRGEVNPVPARPINRPTNIDGINSARTSAFMTGATGMPAANPFVGSNSKPTPSVSFGDPAMEPAMVAEQSAPTQEMKPKKKSNKAVLIVLSIIAFLVAIALAVVLIMEVMGIGPFATNNNSGQASNQSQSSSSTSSNSNSGSSTNNSGTNSNSGASNNGGTSSNGGASSNGSGSDNSGTGTIASSGSIVCDSVMTDEGGLMESEIIFSIKDNKILDVTIKAVVTDASGNKGELSDTKAFSELIDDGELSTENDYVGRDGTLKVTMQELASYLENNLDVDSALTCAVK